jgi:hypothetical protein
MVRSSLLQWYDVHRRRLPWRGDPPPYGSGVESKQMVRPGASYGDDPGVTFQHSGGADRPTGCVYVERRWLHNVLMFL